MKYKLPPKYIDRKIEIEGIETFELPKVSFTEKMDFLTWLEKMKDENPNKIIEQVIWDNIPAPMAEVVMGSENMVFISEIYAQIVACKLGMSVEDYLQQTEKLNKKQN